jgi:hypothetical protein
VWCNNGMPGLDHMGLDYVMKEAKQDKLDKYLNIKVLGTRGSRDRVSSCSCEGRVCKRDGQRDQA